MNYMCDRYDELMGGGGCRVPVIADVHYNRVKGYWRKFTIGYIGNSRSKHRDPQYEYIKALYRGGSFFNLNSFLTKKIFLVPQYL